MVNRCPRIGRRLKPVTPTARKRPVSNAYVILTLHNMLLRTVWKTEVTQNKRPCPVIQVAGLLAMARVDFPLGGTDYPTELTNIQQQRSL